MIHQLAKNTTNVLSKTIYLSDDQKEVVCYGLEILLGAGLKLFLFITTSFALGIGFQALIAAATSGLLRLFSGGAHCATYFRCTVGYLTIYVLIGFLAKYQANILFNEIGALLIIFSSYLVVKKWAPALTEARPIKNQHRIKKLQRLSKTVLFLFFVIVVLNMAEIVNIPETYFVAGILGIIAQTFSITPLGYKVFEKLDQLASFK